MTARIQLEDQPMSADDLRRWLDQLDEIPPDEPDSDLWLNGNVWSCCCPECSAPITVRRWLRVADCWNCGISIALDEWAEGRSSEAQDGTSQPVTPRSSAAMATPMESSTAGFDRGLAAVTMTPTTAATATVEAPAPPAPAIPATPSPSNTSPGGQTKVRPRRRRSLRAIPAWLSSLLFHLLMLIILALITWRQTTPPPRITLALEVGPERRVGDRESLFSIEGERFDLPLPEGDRPRSDRERVAVLQANQDARELRVDPHTTTSNLAPLRSVLELARSEDVNRRAMVFRDPRLRVQLVRQEGGTTLTEAAVARGLRWIAAQQLEDGSWGLRRRAYRQAGTSLALLPFLGAGQTHWNGIYVSTVSGGLRYLLDQQEPDGDLRGDSSQQFGMYVHGQATIVLCEAYAMTQDERLRHAAQRAVDFIVRAQHPRGGWRYEPKQPGDTSVLGWQLMALQSARAAGLAVPTDTLDLADQYLETVQTPEGAFYAYQPGREPTHVMTAEALLCRMYLGWTIDHPGLQLGIRELIQEFPPDDDDPDFYYWYYATQAAHHVGGRQWSRWNERLREVVVSLQRNARP